MSLVDHPRRNSPDSPKIKKHDIILQAKNNSSNIRSTHLKEISKEANQQENFQEEGKLYTILTTEKSKEKDRRLRFLWPKEKTGVLWLKIDTEIRNDEVTPELREIEQKGQLQTI